MLKIYYNLFQELRSEKISFCNWKGHYNLQSYLEGIGDLDLFVLNDHRLRFEEILKKNNFINVSSFQASHDSIEHFIGLDNHSGKLVHLHVYFELVTGESFTKNYKLPLENFILKNIVYDGELAIVNKEAALVIFLVRYFIKIGSLYGLFQFYRDQEKYLNELKYLGAVDVKNDIKELNISLEYLKSLHQTLVNKSFIAHFFASISFKRKIRNYKKRSFLRYYIYVVNNIFDRVLNRLILKRKKQLIEGIVIGVCGLDGTGKSSLVSSLEKVFSNHISTKKLHLGRPQSSILTLPFNFILLTYKKIRSSLIKKETFLGQKNLSKKQSLAFLMRSLVLGFDRLRQAKTAQNYQRKGYIVICDRYPGTLTGKMDSPRITENPKEDFIHKIFRKLETTMYEKIPPAGIIFYLKAPVEVAVERNNKRDKVDKESEEEIRHRYLINSEAVFKTIDSKNVDATNTIKDVFLDVQSSIWSKIKDS
tara:strand:+ start:780 stop:2213 length:1434 start_codon:yes stop_codon:yes gene_type:complete